MSRADTAHEQSLQLSDSRLIVCLLIGLLILLWMNVILKIKVVSSNGRSWESTSAQLTMTWNYLEYSLSIQRAVKLVKCVERKREGKGGRESGREGVGGEKKREKGGVSGARDVWRGEGGALQLLPEQMQEG